jgi:beta-N-acetylhexosaminidase
MKKAVTCLICTFLLMASGCFAKASAEEDMESRIDSILKSMTLEEKIYQLFIVEPEAVADVKTATKATEATRKGLNKYPVGGIVYFADNIAAEEQIKKMIANSQAYAAKKRGISLLIAVDEEGGTISRVADKLNTTRFEPMEVIGARGDAREAYTVGATIAGDISRLGFNLDFAPVADVIMDSANTEIGSRSFGTDPALVSDMVGQVVKGLQENGVMATLKHFPGHGSTTANSHEGESISTRTLFEMEQAEFLPFQEGMAAGAEFVMMSHLTAVEIDKESPASLSKTIITDILRDKLGFEGLVITDSLQMKAAADLNSSGETAVRELEAGVDVLLMPVNLYDAARGIEKAVDSGRLTEERIDESVRRVLNVKWEYGLIEP